MTSKKYIIKTITYFVIILIFLGIITVVLDPFSHFHDPLFGMGAVETNERSALIGVAKNSNYDTLLLGSSMSENFEDAWFEDGVIGNSAIKVCLQGAHFSDYKVILDEAINKPELKTVVFCLDTYLLTNNPDDNPVTIPEYLSNKKVWDDSYYVWNKSVIFEFLPKFIINNIRYKGSDDKAYVWSDDYEFGSKIAIREYINNRPIAISEMKKFDEYFDYSDQFINSIIPYIESRPDVSFIFYCPPYSMLFWDYSLRTGNIEAETCALERVMKELLTKENVRIFYFQDDINIVSNLDNYRDYSHFKQDVNRYMYECIRDGKKEVTNETYFDKLLNMYEYALEYDYESLFH